MSIRINPQFTSIDGTNRRRKTGTAPAARHYAPRCDCGCAGLAHPMKEIALAHVGIILRVPTPVKLFPEIGISMNSC